jgi:sister-chromatid-cohesion protein PDS5
MGQDDENFTKYTPLALHLVKEFFLSHDSKDVQLLVGCCIADILRVFAPEAPYKEPEQIKVSRNNCPITYRSNLNPFSRLF